MEAFWYIIAATGAGLGTGLAGLSAATVMVPILIVLCPSFTGETGAYQATAIALASDILASAVTTFTYVRYKNIDLKRGWIMLVCILSMCTIGSYAAWLAGNVVLGSFTLFLTFCIGIRFLVKPDTSRESTLDKGTKLDAKGVVISLFFGLTIGFGTGFVGTGGGMMMLVVFTAFLGMELKTAVGTSTFIMTFTALIASVSHILIHPAIVLDRWNVLLICIIVTTVTSRISAQFANRVNNRTIGLVTGAVLTILGAAMLYLHYRELLSHNPLLYDTISCMGTFILYMIPCLVVLLFCYRYIRMPRYVFRKCLHLAAFSCVTVILFSARWQAAALTAVIIALAIYPVLTMLEDRPWFDDLFVQKSPGEVRRSLLLLFFTFALLMVIGAGYFKNTAVCASAILMWGTGDAAAALIGIPYGKHKIKLSFTEGKKSLEGSGGMLMVSFMCGWPLLVCCGHVPLGRALPAALISAAAGTVVEQVSPSEYDTATVPIAILTVLLLILV